MAAPAGAQPLDLPTRQAMAGVELELSLVARDTGRTITRETTRTAEGAGQQVRIGSQVAVCFTATRTGFVTLWSVDEANRPVRIYPNRFSHDDAATMRGAPVTEGQEYCVGNDQRFGFTVAGTPGQRYQLSLNWTPTEAEALPADAHIQLGRSPRWADERAAGFAATHLSYAPVN